MKRCLVLTFLLFSVFFTLNAVEETQLNLDAAPVVTTDDQRLLNPEPFQVSGESQVELSKTPSGFSYVPYSDDEFTTWQKKLRRGEILLFGGLPIAFTVVNLGYAAFGQDGSFWSRLGISAGISALVSLADFIIGQVREKNAD